MKVLFQSAVIAVFAIFMMGTAHADDTALVRTLPMPDTSKLPADVAKRVIATRADFDKVRIGLVGDDLALAYATMGAEYLHSGFADIAAIAFYDASQLAPKDARWWYLRGVAARAQKRNVDARAAFESALAMDQVYLPIRYRLADTLIDLGRLDAAHKVLADALPAAGKHAVVFAMLGRLELRQKNYVAAVEHLQQALALEPQANALYKDLADAYAAQGNAARARAEQAKAGTTQPNLADPLVAAIFGAAQPATPPLSGSLLEQARQLLAAHDFARARDKAAAAHQAEPKDVEALALLARLDALLGHGAFARDEAANALRLGPDNANANLSQGMVHEFGGDDAKALPYYRRAVQRNADSPDAHLLLGNALMRRGHYAEAAAEYRQLRRLLPDSANSEARLAAALAADGHCDQALADVAARLSRRTGDGNLTQVFVRLASTCRAASADDRRMALEYGIALYKQRPNAADSTALALAQAANGKFDDAQKAQAEAIFEAVRAGDTARAAMYRQTMRTFTAHQVPDQPWPADHVLRKPALLQTVAAAAPKKD